MFPRPLLLIHRSADEPVPPSVLFKRFNGVLRSHQGQELPILLVGWLHTERYLLILPPPKGFYTTAADWVSGAGRCHSLLPPRGSSGVTSKYCPLLVIGVYFSWIYVPICGCRGRGHAGRWPSQECSWLCTSATTAEVLRWDAGRTSSEGPGRWFCCKREALSSDSQHLLGTEKERQAWLCTCMHMHMVVHIHICTPSPGWKRQGSPQSSFSDQPV